MKLSIITRGKNPETQSVFIRYNHGKSMCRLATGVVVSEKEFQNVDGKYVKPSAANHTQKNIAIQKKKSDVELFALQYYSEHGEYPSADTMARHFDKTNVQEPNLTFSKVWDIFVKDISSRDKQSVGNGRLKHYQTAKANIIEFDPYFTFEKVDMNFYYSFMSWLRDIKKNGGNTIGAKLILIKTFLFWSIENKYASIDIKIVRSFKTKWEERDIIFHTDEELRKLHELDLSHDKGLNDARNSYLFQCHTGLRFSDLKPDRWSLGVDMLRLKAQKTNKEVRIPLTPEAHALIDYYVSNNKPFPQHHNHDYNEKLKLVGSAASIVRPIVLIMGRKKFKAGETIPMYKLMSSHVARATFVCSMRRHGLHIEDIAVMLGVNPITLKHYLKIEDKTLLASMDRVIASRGDLRVSHVAKTA